MDAAYLESTAQGWWNWSNGVINVFLAHFKPVNTNQLMKLSIQAYLSTVADHVLFIATTYPASNDYYRHAKAPSHLKLVS